MGFGKDDLQFLLSAFKLGLESRAVLTLGRQNLFIKPRKVSKILQKFGRSGALSNDKAIYFADDVFQILGFEQIDSMDASAYEGANIIHDMNNAVPESLHNSYDLIWDGGTLEHIFNFPIAIANAMRMVKLGGHLIFISPANNLCGHGFYQFSPELFFRVLSADNGFEIIRIYLREKGGLYHVSDPAIVGGRVELCSNQGSYLMVHARKIKNTDIFATIPQQSDYVTAWGSDSKKDGMLKAYLRRVLSPASVISISYFLNTLRQQQRVRAWRKNASLNNRSFFTPVTNWEVPSPSCRVT